MSALRQINHGTDHLKTLELGDFELKSGEVLQNARIAYATFGTPALAASVRSALVARQAALMANHGSVAVGADLAAAVEHALLLEWLCALHHRASALGAPRVLTPAQQTTVVEAAIARAYGTPQPVDAAGHPEETP